MLKTDLVEVAWVEERKTGWEFQGRKVRGVELLFSAIDRNYIRQNEWRFTVRLPNDITQDYVGVMPSGVPNRKVWAGLERRSLQFRQCSIGNNKKHLYAKLFIEDVHGTKNKRVLTEDDSKLLPKWLNTFAVKPKRKVASTDGNDGRQLVGLVRPDDFATMIRMFIALKGWVQDQEYDPQSASNKAILRKRQLIEAGPLRGKRIAITGRLVRDVRANLFAWFRKLGAEPKAHVTSMTDLLIVGYHHKDDDRKKIRDAKAFNIPQLSESKFYQKYGL